MMITKTIAETVKRSAIPQCQKRNVVTRVKVHGLPAGSVLRMNLHSGRSIFFKLTIQIRTILLQFGTMIHTKVSNSVIVLVHLTLHLTLFAVSGTKMESTARVRTW